MSELSTRQITLIVLLLILVAAIPRLYQLGEPGFYGDEETTSFPARSLAEGDGPRMPSGMLYFRALPLTVLNAASARIFGIDEELSYRVPAALFGILTVAIFFLLAGPLFGWPVALVAAVLLAVSEWHIAASREARMYAPFLLCYTACGLMVWRWVSTNATRYLWWALFLLVCAMGFHSLSRLAVLFFLIPLAMAGWSRVSPVKLLTLAVLGGIAAQLYNMLFITTPYKALGAGAFGPPKTGSDFPRLFPTSLVTSPQWLEWLLLAAGAAVGLWLASSARSTEPPQPADGLRRLAWFILGAAGVALLFVGQLYGAMLLLLVLFVIHPEPMGHVMRKRMPAIGLMLLAAACWITISVNSAGLGAGIRQLIEFPFPYLFYFIEMTGAIVVIFMVMAIFLAMKPRIPADAPLRACVLAVLLPLFPIGILSAWGGRYAFGAYPFVLLLGAYGLVAGLVWVGKRTGKWNEPVAAVLVAVVVLSGALGMHGLPQAARTATVTYGDSISQMIYHHPLYPDHAAPGEYVANRRKPGDIVIAEDSLQAFWYAGPVDYWFRDVRARRFAYKDDKGDLRDIYVNSRLATAQEFQSITEQSGKCVWLITSGETYGHWQHTLDEPLSAWLATLMENETPAFEGRDRATFVYGINCS